MKTNDAPEAVAVLPFRPFVRCGPFTDRNTKLSVGVAVGVKSEMQAPLPRGYRIHPALGARPDYGVAVHVSKQRCR
jgi:hypothetical protein